MTGFNQSASVNSHLLRPPYCSVTTSPRNANPFISFMFYTLYCLYSAHLYDCPATATAGTDVKATFASAVASRGAIAKIDRNETMLIGGLGIRTFGRVR